MGENLNDFVLIILPIILTGATTFIVFLLERRIKARDTAEAIKEKEREKRELERGKEYGAIKDGITAILRDRIIQADMHFTERGFATVSQKDNLQMMYTAYHKLGGNGIVTQSYDHIMSMPIAKEGDKS